MDKYRLLRELLLSRGTLSVHDVLPAPLAPRPALEAVHDPDYVAAVFDGELDMTPVGFPWSEALVRRCLASVGGTLAAADTLFDAGAGPTAPLLAGNLAGGTHHAHRDRGAGYCVFNDIAVAARHLQATGRVRRVLVFDVDVHQGDGTAAIFAADPDVYTCSVHGGRNFPARKAVSDLDVALDDGTTDSAYLTAVARALDTALEALASAGGPDVAFYQGGVDPLEHDKLGRLAVSADGLRRRDELVLGRLVGAGIPVVLTMGGGYAEPIGHTVEAHATTWAVAADLAANTRPA